MTCSVWAILSVRASDWLLKNNALVPNSSRICCAASPPDVTLPWATVYGSLGAFAAQVPLFAPTLCVPRSIGEQPSDSCSEGYYAQPQHVEAVLAVLRWGSSQSVADPRSPGSLGGRGRCFREAEVCLGSDSVGTARQVFEEADNVGQSLGRNRSVALVHDSGLPEKGPIEEYGALSRALAIHAGFNQQSSDAGDSSRIDSGNDAGEVFVLGSPRPDSPV